LFSCPAQARVFNFENESVAPYLNLRGGMSGLGSAPYQWQSAASYGGDDVGFNYGGEFGVYFSLGALGLGLGMLVDSFDPVTGGTGADAGGSQLFTVNTEGISYGPHLFFDYILSAQPSSRWKLVVGGGYQYLKLENNYNFTTAGQALVSGQSSLLETYKTSALFATLGVATEFVMAGTTTMSILLGYHHSFAEQWNYDGGVTNFAGTNGPGAAVVFEDASTKTMDWSYPFLQLGFQFYVDKVR
jgi:hypothetical protein